MGLILACKAGEFSVCEADLMGFDALDSCQASMHCLIISCEMH